MGGLPLANSFRTGSPSSTSWANTHTVGFTLPQGEVSRQPLPHAVTPKFPHQLPQHHQVTSGSSTGDG